MPPPRLPRPAAAWHRIRRASHERGSGGGTGEAVDGAGGLFPRRSQNEDSGTDRKRRATHVNGRHCGDWSSSPLGNRPSQGRGRPSQRPAFRVLPAWTLVQRGRDPFSAMPPPLAQDNVHVRRPPDPRTHDSRDLEAEALGLSGRSASLSTGRAPFIDEPSSASTSGRCTAPRREKDPDARGRRVWVSEADGCGRRLSTHHLLYHPPGSPTVPPFTPPLIVGGPAWFPPGHGDGVPRLPGCATPPFCAQGRSGPSASFLPPSARGWPSPPTPPPWPRSLRPSRHPLRLRLPPPPQRLQPRPPRPQP